jgi:glycosidase
MASATKFTPLIKQTDVSPSSYTKTVPEWSKNLTIYEVNLRQYSTSGSFKDFEKHLPRLQELGVGIIWFMPIQPIGVMNRKGTLGSYYSIKDYLSVSPEYGTMEEFKQLVKKVHELGMYVIIDWVANHTSWDNSLITEHPEFYTKDSIGKIISPVPDWTDVADLNYDNKGLRRYMIDALKFWLKETDIDGFRCDVAGMVPTDFWEEARPALDSIKKVFMLAEWEDPKLHDKAFDMTYTWDFHHLITDIAKGSKKVSSLDTLFTKEKISYSKDAYRMYFTSNHDENSWNGTAYEKFGKGVKAFAVLTFVVPGMPLIYSGQEAGLNKRLKFFDKDTIEWKTDEFFNIYKTLIALKKRNKALWNGAYGGEMKILKTSVAKNVLAFTRINNPDEILAVFNFSDKSVNATIKDLPIGIYKNVFTKKVLKLNKNTSFNLGPWEYLLMEK